MNFKRWVIFLIMIVGLGIVGCSHNSTPTSHSDNNDSPQLIVAVSILPQADLVRMIGGEQVEVIVMIPPGSSPDSFEPSTKDLRSLSKADLYIKVGHLPFEDAWMDRMLAANKDLTVVDTSKGIEIIEHDPHIWLSPRLAQKQAQTIAAALSEVDAAHKEYYQANLNTTIETLEKMDLSISAMLENVQGRSFLVYHPAWGYLARDYGLTEMAIEDHGKEPAPAEMAQIIANAKEQGIKTVFASPQHSTRSAEAIAAELGAQVVTIDPLPGKYEDILHSVELISTALGDK